VVVVVVVVVDLTCGVVVDVVVVVVVVVEYSDPPFQNGSRWLFPIGIGTSPRGYSQQLPLVGDTRSDRRPMQMLILGIEIF
jgi:hypothetical protein